MSVVVLMDTVYWGHNFGLVVMKDSHTHKKLLRKFIRQKETLVDYQKGFDWLLENGFKKDGIVSDGLRGMFQMFAKYRVPICQFHQVSIMKRCLTQNPELEVSK